MKNEIKITKNRRILTSKKTNNDAIEQFKLLINARNFHYENFNKWMTYYYVAIGALFVGFYTMKSANNNCLFEYSILTLVSCQIYYDV